MSKRIAPALCLVLLLPVSAAFAQVLPVKPVKDPDGLPPEIAALIWKAQEATLDGRHRDALLAVDGFLTYGCDSDRTMDVLRALTASVRADPGRREMAGAILRRALTKHPFGRNVKEVRAAVGAIHSFSMSRWERRNEQCLVPGEETTVRLFRRGGPPSSITVWRIGDDRRREVFGRLPIDGEWPAIPDLALAAANREQWERVEERTVSFPETWGLLPQPREIRGWFRLTLDRPGLYVLEEEIDGFTACHPFLVLGYVPVVRAVGNSKLLFVARPWTGEPVPGVRVEVRQEDRNLEGVTGADGTFSFTGKGDGLILCDFKGETAVLAFGESRLENLEICHIAPDRPLYRPGDLIHFRAVWRSRRDGHLIPPAGEPVRVVLESPGDEENQLREGIFSTLGTFSGTLALPENAPPGTWRLEVLRPEGAEGWVTGASRRIRVAEFERPEIRLSVEIDPSARLLGEPVRAIVRAEHWWGAPAAGIPVFWRASARGGGRRRDGDATGLWQPRPFPDPRSWFYGGDSPPQLRDDADGGAGGEGVTVPDGTFVIEIPTARNEHAVAFRLEVVLKPPSGREVETSRELLAWPARVSVRVGADRMFAEPDREVRATAAVTDQDGQAVADRAVKLTVLRGKLTGKMVEFTPWRTLDAITGDDGRARFTFDAPESGRLRLKALVPDGEGRTAVHRVDLLVAAPQTRRIRDRSGEILVLPDRAVYQAGETARLLVDGPTRSPLLLTVAGERFHGSRIVRLGERMRIVEVKIDRTWAPGVYVKLLGLSGGDYEKERIHSGGCELLVLPPEGPVNVTVQTDRRSYGLREQGELTVVTTRDGVPVPAEVQLAVVDEAIFALVNEDPASIDPDLTPSLGARFFASVNDEDVLAAPWPPYPAWTTLNGWTSWISTFRNHHPGFSFGEGEAPAAAGYAPATFRGRLPDTLLWRGSLVTDENGRATIEFETPDRLTTWRVVARAVAGNEAFGEGRSEMITSKLVAVRIGGPRCLTETDEGTVAVSVRSDLDEPAEFLLRLVVSGPAEGGGEEKVRVAAGGDASVEFPLRGTGAGTVVLRAEALSTAESDAIEERIPGVAWGEPRVVRREAIAAPDAEIVVGSADAFEVRVQGPAELARELAPHVLDWEPVRDPEGIAWRMLALLATGHRPTEEDVFRLTLLMGEDGSFHSPWSNPRPVPVAVRALSQAKKAGLPVPAAALEKSLAWLARIGGDIGGRSEPTTLQTILEGRQGGVWATPLRTARAICALAALGGDGHAKPEIIRSEGRIVIHAGDEIPLLVTAVRREESEAPPPLTSLAEGLSIERSLERFDGESWRPVASGESVGVGDRLRFTLEMRGVRTTRDVEIVSPLPGGAVAEESGRHSSSRLDWFRRAEFHPDRVILHLKRLPVGLCTFTFMLRPVRPGTWHIGPAKATSKSSPDRRGRSGAFVLKVR